MALIRWEPVRELTSLQGEVNRLFNTFFDAPSSGEGPANGGVMRRWVPPMDLVETESHFVLRADLPGLSEQDITVEVEDDLLTISGERTAEHEGRGEGFYRVERAFGSFRRSLTLPDGIEPDAVQARFDKGVLELRIPKPEQRRPQRVAIQIGRDPEAIEGRESGEDDGGAGAAEPTS